MQPMPLESVPFKQAGINIVGPLILSSSRHKFLLVLASYATRYPKAIPLCNMRADTIARQLAQIFT